MVLLFNSSLTFAQNPQSRLWSAPPQNVQFPSNAVATLPSSSSNLPAYDGVTPSGFANNIMHDIQGNVLFSIVDGSVYDKNGLLIGQIVKPVNFAPVRGATEWLIIPMPGNCMQYYLVGGEYQEDNPTGVATGGDPLPYYIILDLSIQNNLNGNPNAKGDLINPITMQQTSEAAFLSGVVTTAVHYGALHFAVTEYRPQTQDYLLFISDALDIDVIRVTANGFSAPVQIANTDMPSATNSGRGRNELEIVQLPSPTGNGNYRIGLGYQATVQLGSSPHKIYVADLDFVTGLLLPGTERVMNLPYIAPTVEAVPHGLEFSADGNFLYVTHTNIQSPYIQYADLSNTLGLVPLSSAISNPLTFAPSEANFQHSQIELSNDGWILFASAQNISGMDMLPTMGNPIGVSWMQNRIPLGVPISEAIFASNNSNPDLNNIRLLNDQIDGSVYQYYAPSSPPDLCCIANTSFTVDVYKVGTTAPITPNYNGSAPNQVWTPNNNPFGGTSSTPVSTVTVRTSIIIPAGYQITISGMRFEFAPRTYDASNTAYAGANVEVLRANTATSSGGRLIVQNSTLTVYAGCGEGMWEGIEVHGYSNVPQGSLSSTPQGYLLIRNSSAIENAWRGIVASQVANPLPPAALIVPQLTTNTTGGIVRAYESRFTNNFISAYFPYYMDNHLR